MQQAKELLISAGQIRLSYSLFCSFFVSTKKSRNTISILLWQIGLQKFVMDCSALLLPDIWSSLKPGLLNSNLCVESFYNEYISIDAGRIL